VLTDRTPYLTRKHLILNGEATNAYSIASR
jgi:hypothetical protein